MILLGKSAMKQSRETIVFYTFLTVVLVFRACLAAFIEPWSSEPVLAAEIGQLIGSVGLAAIIVIVTMNLWLKGRNVGLPN